MPLAIRDAGKAPLRFGFPPCHDTSRLFPLADRASASRSSGAVPAPLLAAETWRLNCLGRSGAGRPRYYLALSDRASASRSSGAVPAPLLAAETWRLNCLGRSGAGRPRYYFAIATGNLDFHRTRKGAATSVADPPQRAAQTFSTCHRKRIMRFALCTTATEVAAPLRVLGMGKLFMAFALPL